MTRARIGVLKTAVWLGCLGPLCRLLYRGLSDDLGANPIEFVTLSTGTWTLVLVLAALAVTPLRKLTGQNWLIRFRRLIGLFAFFYALLHLTTYVWLDKFFDLREMLDDVVKRRFITMGLLSLTLMAPLALTSTTWAVRKLGGKNWQRLHRLIYASAAAGVIHFWWKVKADVREPAIFASVLAVLLAMRIVIAVRARRDGRSRTLGHPSRQEATHG